MKICTLTSIFPRYIGDHCGAGTTIYDTSRNLKLRHGVDVSVVAPNHASYPKYEELEGIKVFRFFYFWPRKLQKLTYGAGMPTNMRKFKLAKIQLPLFILNFFLRAFNVARKNDLIHIHWILNGIVGVPLGIILRKPIVISVHRVVSSSKMMGRLIKFIVRHAEFLFFNSSYTQRELLKIITPKGHCIIPCTIDLQKFTPGPKGRIHRDLGLSADTKIILYVGYLIEKKGLPYLIQAVQQLVAQGHNVHLVLGGGGIALESLQALAQQLGLASHVTFLGWVKNAELPEYYRDADVFVLPSIIDSNGETETLGIVLLEALACGTPVVGSNVGGIPDVVHPEVGFLAEPKNPDDLAQKLERLLKDDALRAKMGARAIEWARNNFTWEKVSEKYMEVYERILTKPEKN